MSEDNGVDISLYAAERAWEDSMGNSAEIEFGPDEPGAETDLTNAFPSPEYIKWCREHPFEDWEPAFGDWFVATKPYEQVEGDDWPCVDIEIGEVNVVHDAYRIDDDGKSARRVGVSLPTLGQLVRMIDWPLETVLFQLSRGKYDNFGELMIAAAQLLDAVAK